MTTLTLNEALNQITPASESAIAQAWEHWDAIAMPLRSLGRLQQTITRIAGMTGTPRVKLDKKALVVFCADNGVVAEGVTQTGQEVTKIVAENFLKENTTAAIFCRETGADICPIDIGLVPDSSVRNCKVARGTKNMAVEPAMTRNEAIQALETGIMLACEKKEQGYDILATGEMGIGNTTTSSAIASVLLEKRPEEVTGKGAGLSSEGMKRKIHAIETAIQKHQPDKNDAVDVISKVGGFDIAGMTGLFLGGAALHMPVVADGFISCVAALCAIRMCPAVKDYVITSHKSKEPGTRMLLEAIDIPVFLDCDMCLGEGTGAVAIFPLLDLALSVYNGMSTFADNDIEQYVPQN